MSACDPTQPAAWCDPADGRIYLNGRRFADLPYAMDPDSNAVPLFLVSENALAEVDDPRVEVDSYVVRPTGYSDLVHSDKDAWCLTVTNGHAFGWSIRRGVGMSGGGMAMNRKGEWIGEARGSGHNRTRRWPLEEALAIALRHIDDVRINGKTAREASDSVAARIARRDA